MLSILMTFSLGAIVGSFINVVTYRLPIMLQANWIYESSEFLESQGLKVQRSNDTAKYESFNLFWPPSHCPLCKYKIRPWENIPLLSYVYLKRKCSNCGKEISKRYPITELICGLLTMFLAYYFQLTSTSFVLIVLMWSLLTIAIIDLNHHLIPDEITQPLIWVGLIVNSGDIIAGVNLSESVLGAILGYISLWTVNWFFKIIRKQEGMGHGDFKLLAAIGAWLGWQSLFATIIISSLTGAVSGIFMITFFRKNKSQPIPFGPHLSVAAIIFIVWGTQINNFYLTNIVR